jgi:hypothetical protein
LQEEEDISMTTETVPMLLLLLHVLQPMRFSVTKIRMMVGSKPQTANVNVQIASA